MKDWQCGIELDLLKAYALPFKENYKAFCHGAFGCPKERDLASALAAHEVSFIRDGNGFAAVAIFSILKSGSSHADFSGREVKIQRGDLFVRHLAFKPGAEDAARKLLAHFLGAPVPAVWFELHEENAPVKGIALASGMEWVLTKVSAGSDVRGLYVGGQAGKARIASAGAQDGAELPGIACLKQGWLSTREHGAALVEIESFGTTWANHYSVYNKGGTWSALALRGYDPKDPLFIIKPGEMSKEWKEQHAALLKAKPDWTPVIKHFPTLMKFVDRLPGTKDRVRLMRLAPGGGELTRHADITDRDAGVADGKLARLHIPIITNPKVWFQSWDARGQMRKLTMQEKGLYYLDQRKPHACKNEGKDERVHLVVDTQSGPEVRALIRSAK